MVREKFRFLVIAAFAMLAAALARPALAQGFPAGSTCRAEASLTENYARLSAQPGRWTCDATGWSIDAPRAILRFDLRSHKGPAPLEYTTRQTGFDRLTLTTISTEQGSPPAAACAPTT